MGLAPGTRLGPYEVLAPLGAGGMGEVYRARDERLGRDVALKVLPEALRDDAERLRRFETEARAAGALNHPNVLAVLDVGTADGAPYLVTELLEGRTLRDRLREGPLPPRKALDVAAQVAHGLAAAHEKSIIHRDLKPENLFLTKDGRVKILDFGLAKALAGTSADPALESTLAETGAGVVLGSAGYMAPEQVRGKPADQRADIFAFGAVLYEMLAGERAFDGDSHVERGHAILTQEPPDLGASGVAVAPAVERVIRRCLEKVPDERFQSARDLAFALEALADTSGVSGRDAAAPTAWAQMRPYLNGMLMVVLIGAGVVAGATWRGYTMPRVSSSAPASQPAAPALKWTRVDYRAGYSFFARFASDGRTIVHGGAYDGNPMQVFATVIGKRDSRAVTPPWHMLRAVSHTDDIALLTPGARRPAGRWWWNLARASLAGSAPREVLENVDGADFGPDGSLMVVRQVGHRWRLEYPIGRALYETEGAVGWPRVSPKGDRIAFIDQPMADDIVGSIQVMTLDGVRRTLAGPLPDAQFLAWAPNGREVWFSGGRGGPGAVYAVTLAGKLRKVLEGPDGLCILDVAPDGRALVSVSRSRECVVGRVPGVEGERDLAWRDGSVPMDLSRDGRTLLFAEMRQAAGERPQAFIRRTDGSPAIQLAEGVPRALSPDGAWALVSPGIPYNTLTLVPTGPGSSRPLEAGSLAAINEAFFFSDGKRILILGRATGKPLRLWVQDLAAGPPRPIGGPDVVSSTPPSPDGTMAAVTDADGRAHLVPLAGGTLRPLALPVDDVPLQWSDDGKRLFVRRARQLRRTWPLDVYAFELATGTRRPWRALQPADLTGVPHGWEATATRVLITPDGRWYVFSHPRRNTTLQVVEGLR